MAERRRCLPEVILVTARVQLRSLLVVHAIVGEPLGYLDGSVGEACFENPRGLVHGHGLTAALKDPVSAEMKDGLTNPSRTK